MVKTCQPLELAESKSVPATRVTESFGCHEAYSLDE